MLETSNSIVINYVINATPTESVNWIGIDVSKSNLVIANRISPSKFQVITIKNEPSAINTWIKTLSPNDVCILEHTGTYNATLSYLLHQQNIRQSIITPRQSKSFSSGVMKSITKNDERDSVHLLLYAERNNPDFYHFSSENILKIRHLRTALRQQNKTLRVIQNQLHAFEQLPYKDQMIIQMYEQQINSFKENIKRLEQQICTISDDDFKELDKKIQSVVGIGPKTSHAIITATNAFDGFENANQVAKFAGVAPRQESSGNYTAKAKINKNGNKELRATLYMAALSAIKYNNACKELFVRLRAKGKTVKQTFIAVAHKLIKQIWGVVKSGVDFDNEYHIKKQFV
jgi:transposase